MTARVPFLLRNYLVSDWSDTVFSKKATDNLADDQILTITRSQNAVAD